MTSRPSSSSSSSSKAGSGGYQSLREKIISLGLEIEDRQKLSETLQTKVEEERIAMSTVEKNISSEFQHVMEVENENFRAENDRLIKLASSAMEEKKVLLLECKDLVEAIRQLDHESESEARRLNGESKHTLEEERRSFKAGHEERLGKFIQGKLQEFKESTQRALAPEMSRLKQRNASMLSDLDLKYSIDERKLKQEAQNKLLQDIETETSNFRADQAMFHKSKMDSINNDIDAMERENKKKLLQINEECERDVEKLKETLKNKATKHRMQRQAEVNEAMESSRKRMIDLRSKHENDLSMLSRDHEAKLKQLTEVYEIKKKDIDEEFKKSSRKGGLVTLTPEQEEELINYRREAEEERDRRIQAEIRVVQAECIRIEREGKMSIEREKKRIQESREREEREALRRQRKLTDQIAELSSEKEQLLSEAEILEGTADDYHDEIAALKKDIDVYQTGVASQRLRLKDADAIYRRRTDEVEKNLGNTLDNLTKKHDELIELINQVRIKFENEIQDIRNQHDTDLDALDGDVKDEVGRKEDEIRILRDEVETERVKMIKLEKMQKRYEQSSRST